MSSVVALIFAFDEREWMSFGDVGVEKKVRDLWKMKERKGREM